MDLTGLVAWYIYGLDVPTNNKVGIYYIRYRGIWRGSYDGTGVQDQYAKATKRLDNIRSTEPLLAQVYRGKVSYGLLGCHDP